MTVEDILKKHFRPRVMLGREPVKKTLIADLEAHKRFNSKLYGITFAVTCVFSLMLIVTLVVDVVSGDGTRQAILTGAGITAPFVLRWMRRVVREWSQANLVLTLVSHSDEAAIQSLIEKLLSDGKVSLTAAAKSESGN